MSDQQAVRSDYEEAWMLAKSQPWPVIADPKEVTILLPSGFRFFRKSGVVQFREKRISHKRGPVRKGRGGRVRRW